MDADGLSSDFVQMESLRESSRRQIVEPLLRSLPVVKDFDVFRDFFVGVCSGCELPMIDELIFQ